MPKAGDKRFASGGHHAHPYGFGKYAFRRLSEGAASVVSSYLASGESQTRTMTKSDRYVAAVDSGHGFREIRWAHHHRPPFTFKAAKIVPPLKKLVNGYTVLSSGENSQTLDQITMGALGGPSTLYYGLDKTQLDNIQAYNSLEESRLFIEYVQTTFEFCNTSTTPVQFDFYCVTPRRGNTSVVGPKNSILNGLARKFNTAVGVLAYPFMGADMSDDYHIEYKQLKAFHFKMSPGEVIKLNTFIQINRIYTTAMQEQSTQFFPGITHFWWYTLKGTPVVESSGDGITPATKAGLGRAEIAMVMGSVLKFRFPIIAQNKYNYTASYQLVPLAHEDAMNEDSGAMVLNKIG